MDDKSPAAPRYHPIINGYDDHVRFQVYQIILC
jgi:hypothetical protein